MSPWEIKNLVFSNDIYVAYMVIHFEYIYLRRTAPHSLRIWGGWARRAPPSTPLLTFVSYDR